MPIVDPQNMQAEIDALRAEVERLRAELVEADRKLREFRPNVDAALADNARLRVALRKLRDYVDPVVANGIDGVLGEDALVERNVRQT